jgi:hypothetical protein
MHARRELMIRHAGVPGGDGSSGYSRDAEGQNGGTDEQFHGFISWDYLQLLWYWFWPKYRVIV